ncbi:protein Mis18-alpha [Tachysurus fulvidraco]|uniref:protein Mis18-alpha n=1 Tax=Tachysurus fulvidraco TaxID=1234273 RepID=UPI000F4D7D15|nr:protein Mis18-alpha [Tachysurus fulvidraco]
MARQIGSGDIKDDTYVVSEGLSVADSSKVDDDGEGESDAPAVFLCGKCRLPFGDSLSWAGSDDLHNQILLKRVNDNVVIGKEPFVTGTSEELRCLALNLTCRGCTFNLGHMYVSTPKSLDYKRSIFCFMVENIESYVLGSPDQQVAAVDREERPVTFEYMDNVERQLTKIKSLAVTIGQRLLEIEVDLQCKSRMT